MSLFGKIVGLIVVDVCLHKASKVCTNVAKMYYENEELREENRELKRELDEKDNRYWKKENWTRG